MERFLSLYRNVNEAPRLFVPKLQTELAELLTIPTNKLQFSNYERLKELQKLASEQHFTTTPAATQSYGKFQIKITLPLSVARQYYAGSEYLKTIDGAFPVEIYKIDGKEFFNLAQQFRPQVIPV